MKNTLLNDFKLGIFETLATFGLVLIGTGSIVIHQENIWKLGDFGIGLSFGLIIALMILVFGARSGAHMNPVVSVTFYIRNLISFQKLIIYLVFQTTGAIGASFLLRFLFPSNESLGATLPHAGIWQAFFLEVFMTFLLVYLILIIGRLKPIFKKNPWFWIGFLIFLEAYLGGPYSGASMNPARSIGPVVANQNWNYLWIYICAPFTGMLLALRLQKVSYVFRK